MFGEENMYGQSEQIVDSKQRIFLPVSTKREEGDNLALIQDQDFDVYRIYKTQRVDELFDKISEKLSNSKTEAEIRKYKKEIYDLSKTILKTLKVDKMGRVSLGESFVGISKVNIIGARDHLILELKK